MRQTIIFFVLFLHTITSWAQDDWVLTMKNDTIYGKIEFFVMDQYKMDQIKVKEGKKKHQFTPLEIKRISKKGNYYIPYKINGKYQFAQAVVEGYLSWLYYMNPDSKGYEDFNMTLLTKKDGTSTNVSTIGFMRAVDKFLYECESLNVKIENDEYKPKDLKKIVTFYNDCMDQQSVAQTKVSTTVDSAKLQIIDELILSVSEDNTLSTNKELLEMLIDVKNKISEEKSIPAFLKNAVLEGLSKNEDMTRKLNALFE